MFNIRSSRHPSHSSKKVGTREIVDPGRGTTSRKSTVHSQGGNLESTSSSAAFTHAGMGQGTNISNTSVTIDMNPMLDGIVHRNDKNLATLYKDIYYFDSVAGSAVDLISQITYCSEFSLGGVYNKSISRVYEEAVDRLNVRTLLPEASVDYLVLGAHCSSLLYNSKRRKFTDVMCHSAEHLTLTEIPFYSQDPVISVRFPQEITGPLNSKAKELEYLKELVGEDILHKISSGSLTLDPLTTIYIPRKTFSNTETGTSYFKRILPMYLIEKNLYRGTLMESARRQRGILHLTLGSGEEWVAQPEDMEFMTSLFMDADADPLGAIVTTREGVQVDEVRSGGEFWKVNDYSDSILPYKLRALGISEGFLSGDTSYNVADASMNIFIEMLRAYRDMFTRKFFYDRLFPLIAMTNGYAVGSKGKVIIEEGLKNTTSIAQAMNILNNGSKLLLPTVVWAKQLKPEADKDYMDVLDALSQKGLPTPLRMLAAAGGMNLDDLLRQQDDDLAIRRQLKEYSDAIAELSGPPQQEGESESSSRILLSSRGSSSVLQPIGGKRRSLAGRNFEGTGEIFNVSKTGKYMPMTSSSQKERNEKINRNIVKSIKAKASLKAPHETPINFNSKTIF